MPQSSPVILLVEESRFFLTIEKQFLRNVPATILEGKDFEQTLTLCRQTPPSLIYLSFDLNKGSGDELCRQLKGSTQFGKTPIVMICDEGAHEQIARCQAAGCDATLTKPLDKHKFLEIGRSFLSGIRERRRSCLLKVTVDKGNKEFEGNGLDISSGGLFLETNETLEVGALLKLDIHLCRPKETGPWIRGCEGTVAWINTKENPLKPHHPVGYGIKFSELSISNSGLLNGFIKSLND